MTILAPPFASASTIALPMPLLPPVTIATLPVRVIHLLLERPAHRPVRTMRCRTVCPRITARLPRTPPPPPAVTRCPPHHERLPPDRRLCVPLRLRGEHARRPRRLGGVAVPPPPRLAQRVRCAARPRRGHVPLRTVTRDGAGLPPVRARDDGARDHV